MAIPKGIHWQAPVTMMVSLVAGILFAAGHHLFYSIVASRPYTASTYQFAGDEISQQEIDVAVGTAFAFVVRACLFAAVSIAYVQAFWRAIRSRSTELQKIDRLWSALDSAFEFLHVNVWWRCPLLLFLAITAWLIPLASVITPATLSVVLAPNPSSKMLTVPTIAFDSLQFFEGTNAMIDELPHNWMYIGVQYAVVRVASAVAAQGDILPIKAPAPNSTWTQQFPGPYLKCDNVDDSLRKEVLTNYYEGYLNSPDHCQGFSNYFAWTPDSGVNGSMPLVHNTSTNHYKPRTGPIGPMEPPYTGGISTLFVGIFVSRVPTKCPPGPTPPEDFDFYFNGTTLLQCQLHNVTYELDFEYINGDQNIKINIPNLNSSNPVNTTWGWFMPIGSDVDNCPYTFDTSGQECVMDGESLRSLSYQAILAAFNNLLIPSIIGSTERLLSTNLLTDTIELSALSSDSWGPLQNTPGIESLIWTAPVGQVPLMQELEEMFQNITISMMSSALLQPNSTSPWAAPLTNVTYTASHNVYVYAANKLWLAYGLAIGFSTLAVLAGLAALFVNEASYGNNFTTIMRATRTALLSHEMTDSDADGRDPLPKDLARAHITLSSMKSDKDSLLR